MKSEVRSAIDSAIADANRAAEDWLRSKRDIESDIKGLLDSRLNEIVGKLLGFDAHWGDWVVDHCNGRRGESAAGDWLRNAAGNAVKEWLTEQAGKLPALPKTAIASLRDDYLKAFKDELENRLLDKAKADASDVFRQIAGTLK